MSLKMVKSPPPLWLGARVGGKGSVRTKLSLRLNKFWIILPLFKRENTNFLIFDHYLAIFNSFWIFLAICVAIFRIVNSDYICLFIKIPEDILYFKQIP